MEGKVIILTAPSGAGKTTIVKNLLQKFHNLEFSVSACTRKKRPGELHGKDYYFLSAEDFVKKMNNDQFLEWEEVYDGNYYGTLKEEIERLWHDNKVIVFDVDVKGAINLKKYFAGNALSIFIKPPSLEELRKRLRKRQTETEESIQKRLERAKMEIRQEHHFDVVVTNDDLMSAQRKSEEVVKDFIGQKFES